MYRIPIFRHVARGILPLLLLQACAPAQTLYSTDPVDPKGKALPLSSVLRIDTEDGSHHSLAPGESLLLSDGSLKVISSDPDKPGKVIARWPISQIRSFYFQERPGAVSQVDILTPDDLQELPSLPRISELVLENGERLDIEATKLECRWSLDGLRMEIHREGQAMRSFPLEQIRSIRLHRNSLLASTVKSPAFWIAVGTAAGLFVWLLHDPYDTHVADR